VRYWDASALVPLLLEESRSKEMRRRLSEDAVVVTWVWTRVELASAVERLTREGKLSRLERRATLDRIVEHAGDWDEVLDVIAVRSRATALLGRHPLRAADAAHLAAALWVADDDPSGLEFVSLDQRLAQAAEREGLRVLG
jgi:predicted nucleic acid-binding protein